MINIFFMFNSLDPRVDIEFHPRFHVIFNNVSKYGESKNLKNQTRELDTNIGGKDESKMSIKDRIDAFKT